MRAGLRGIPKLAWICALIAVLNAVAWSIITPPFQGRDEVDHFAYVEELAETGSLPEKTSGQTIYPPNEQVALEGLRYYQVRFTPSEPSLSANTQQRQLARALRLPAPHTISGESTRTAGDPPLFYALQTIPYALGSGNVLVQLQLMRLLDALLGGITALLIFLFLREALPGAPWAAGVGAICVALQPTFGFVNGSMNPDALLYLLSAATFLCLARWFRRGATTRLAIALGLVLAAGVLTYFSFIGVLAGALVGLLLLAIRGVRAHGRSALKAPAIAAAIAVAPAVIDLLVKTASGGSGFGGPSTTASVITTHTFFKALSYIWQMYLPPLPGMTHYFAGITTWREIWFDRSIGLYGWMDTTFPAWVDNIALGIAGVIAVLCAKELIAHRQALRSRLSELAAYAAITIAVMGVIGVASYHSYFIEQELSYGEPRYMLPMLALFGAIVVLAIRGAGRRFMPVAGAAMVVLFLSHDVFSQLQTIARFYG